jgi:hypothetical protein
MNFCEKLRVAITLSAKLSKKVGDCQHFVAVLFQRPICRVTTQITRMSVSAKAGRYLWGNWTGEYVVTESVSSNWRDGARRDKHPFPIRFDVGIGPSRSWRGGISSSPINRKRKSTEGGSHATSSTRKYRSALAYTGRLPLLHVVSLRKSLRIFCMVAW